MSEIFEVKVWGDLACFTRPEMKVERVSYEVMTPSAARGILEAIFWKPQFRWHIIKIAVLNEIKHFSIKRNEINSTQSSRSEVVTKGEHYYADHSENRSQRHTLGLRDVSYLITAQQHLLPNSRDPAVKYKEQFLRRLERGQYFHHPYLGCREFEAYFSPPDGNEKPIPDSRDMGLMLFDMVYELNPNGKALIFIHDNDKRIKAKADIKPVFFNTKLEKGVMHIPAELYNQGGETI